MHTHDQQKEKHRPTWVDGVLILLVLAVAFLGARFLYRRYRAASPTVDVQYLLRITGVETDIADAAGGWEMMIPIGASVTSSNGTAELGSVVGIEVTPHTVAVAEDGKVVFADHPLRRDILITVRAAATLTEGDGIRVRDIRVAAGETWDVRVGGYYATGVEILWVGSEAEV